MKHSKSIGFYLNVKEMLEKPKKGKKTPLTIPALFSIFPHYFAFFRTISRTIWQNFPHYFPFFPALYQKPCTLVRANGVGLRREWNMIPRVARVKSRQSDNMPKEPRTTSIHATAKFLKGMKLITSTEFFWSLYTQTLIRTL